MANGIKQFIRAFQSSFPRAVQDFNRREELDRRIALSQQAQEQKRLEAETEKTGQEEALGALVSDDLSPEEKVRFLIDPDVRAAFKQFQDITKSPEVKYRTFGGQTFEQIDNQPIDFTKPVFEEPQKFARFEESPQGLVGITSQGDISLIPDTENLIDRKPVRSTTGFDKEGNKTIAIVYDDGQTVTYNTGLTDKGKVNNPEEFEKTLNLFYKTNDDINKQKFNYLTSLTDELTDKVVLDFQRKTINDKLQQQERHLFSVMPEQARKQIDLYETFLKSERKKGELKEFANFEEAKKHFAEWFAENHDVNKNEIANIVNAWANFKYGQLDEPPVEEETEEKGFFEGIFDFFGGEEKSQQFDPATNNKINQFMQDNGITDREEAIRILKENNRL